MHTGRSGPGDSKRKMAVDQHTKPLHVSNREGQLRVSQGLRKHRKIFSLGGNCWRLRIKQ